MHVYQTNACMFIAAQFTIAKLWNQPVYPSTDEWITKLWDMYTNGILCSHQEEQNYVICREIDGIGEYYGK